MFFLLFLTITGGCETSCLKKNSICSLIKVQNKAEKKPLVKIWKKEDAGDETSDDDDEDPGLVTVPKVIGKQSAAAGDQVRAVGLKVGSTIYRESTVVPGTVLDQYPKPNEKVAKGSSIKLWVAKKLDVPPIDEEKKKKIKSILELLFKTRKYKKEAAKQKEKEEELKAREEAERIAREEAERIAKEGTGSDVPETQENEGGLNIPTTTNTSKEPVINTLTEDAKKAFLSSLDKFEAPLNSSESKRLGLPQLNDKQHAKLETFWGAVKTSDRNSIEKVCQEICKDEDLHWFLGWLEYIVGNIPGLSEEVEKYIKGKLSIPYSGDEGVTVVYHSATTTPVVPSAKNNAGSSNSEGHTNESKGTGISSASNNEPEEQKLPKDSDKKGSGASQQSAALNPRGRESYDASLSERTDASMNELDGNSSVNEWPHLETTADSGESDVGNLDLTETITGQKCSRSSTSSSISELTVVTGDQDISDVLDDISDVLDDEFNSECEVIEVNLGETTGTSAKPRERTSPKDDSAKANTATKPEEKKVAVEEIIKEGQAKRATLLDLGSKSTKKDTARFLDIFTNQVHDSEIKKALEERKFGVKSIETELALLTPDNSKKHYSTKRARNVLLERTSRTIRGLKKLGNSIPEDDKVEFLRDLVKELEQTLEANKELFRKAERKTKKQNGKTIPSIKAAFDYLIRCQIMIASVEQDLSEKTKLTIPASIQFDNQKVTIHKKKRSESLKKAILDNTEEIRRKKQKRNWWYTPPKRRNSSHR